MFQSLKYWDYRHESTTPHITMLPGPQALFCRFFVSYIKTFKRGFILLGFERGNDSAGEVEASQRSAEGGWERRGVEPVFSARGWEGRTQHSVTGNRESSDGRSVRLWAGELRSVLQREGASGLASVSPCSERGASSGCSCSFCLLSLFQALPVSFTFS